MDEIKAFKYKIIWEHDGVKEILYAFTHEDAMRIKSSIDSGAERGFYKDSHVTIEKIEE